MTEPLDNKQKRNDNYDDAVDPDMVQLEESFGNMSVSRPLIKYLNMNKLVKMPTYRSIIFIH